jgi:hypothetical protein
MDFGNNNRLIWCERVRGLAAQREKKRKEMKEKTSLFASSTVVVNRRINETAGSS